VRTVDRLLREELGCERGFADEKVTVLDPCCGTGAYLIEVMKCVAEQLEFEGSEALMGQTLLDAATRRLLGFEDRKLGTTWSGHSYAGRDASITVPVVLQSGKIMAHLLASLDTGASHCLFEGAYAAELGLELTSGILTRFRTANSTFEAYGHEIVVDVLGIVTHSFCLLFRGSHHP
jgi:hypothetical protein